MTGHQRADDVDGAGRFEAGITAGQYPQPPSVAAAGATITTGTSPWLGIRCATCNQTFRRGDRVGLSADRGIQHLDPRLHCAAAPDGPADDSTAGPGTATRGGQDAARFTEGLLRAWPPLNGAPVRTLTEQDWQMTKATSGPASPVCPGCGHTFRAGDAVIICPCAEAPDDERYRSCQLPVHRDPASGLACWEDWRPDGRLIRCPRTHQKLPD